MIKINCETVPSLAILTSMCIIKNNIEPIDSLTDNAREILEYTNNIFNSLITIHSQQYYLHNGTRHQNTTFTVKKITENNDAWIIHYECFDYDAMNFTIPQKITSETKISASLVMNDQLNTIQKMLLENPQNTIQRMLLKDMQDPQILQRMLLKVLQDPQNTMQRMLFENLQDPQNTFEQCYNLDTNVYEMTNKLFTLLISVADGFYLEPALHMNQHLLSLIPNVIKQMLIRKRNPLDRSTRSTRDLATGSDSNLECRSKYFEDVVLLIHKNSSHSTKGISYEIIDNLPHQKILSQINQIIVELPCIKPNKDDETRSKSRHGHSRTIADYLPEQMATIKHNINMNALVPSLSNYLNKKIIDEQKYYLERDSDAVRIWALYIFKWQYIKDNSLDIQTEFAKDHDPNKFYPLTEEMINKKLGKLFRKIKQQCNECRMNKHAKCIVGKCLNCCTNEICGIDKTKFPLERLGGRWHYLNSSKKP